MYLAQFELDGENIIQGVVRFPRLLPREGQEQKKWLALLARLLRDMNALPYNSSGLRVVLSNHGTLERFLLVSVPAVNKKSLQLYLASFTRLEPLTVNSVQFPMSREEYDKWMACFPHYRCHLDLPKFIAGG